MVNLTRPGIWLMACTCLLSGCLILPASQLGQIGYGPSPTQPSATQPADAAGKVADTIDAISPALQRTSDIWLGRGNIVGTILAAIGAVLAWWLRRRAKRLESELVNTKHVQNETIWGMQDAREYLKQDAPGMIAKEVDARLSKHQSRETQEAIAKIKRRARWK